MSTKMKFPTLPPSFRYVVAHVAFLLLFATVPVCFPIVPLCFSALLHHARQTWRYGSKQSFGRRWRTVLKLCSVLCPGSRDEYREDVADMEAFDQHLEEELSNLFSEYEGSHSGSRYHDQDAEYEGYVQRHSRDARYGGVEEEAEHKYSGHYDEAEVSGSESSEGRAWRDDDNSFHSDEEGDGGENHVTTAPLKHPAYQWSGTRDAQPRGYAAIHRGFKD